MDAVAALDRAVLDAIQSVHAPWLDLLASLVTVLGQTEVVGVVALGVAIARLRSRRRDWWTPLLVAIVVAAELALKLLIPREPPPHELARGIELVPFLRAPIAHSFPSGHVARVAFIGTALRWRRPLVLALVLLMSVTRVYLADHWPSDVLGGCLLGYLVGAIGLRLRATPNATLGTVVRQAS